MIREGEIGEIMLNLISNNKRNPHILSKIEILPQYLSNSISNIVPPNSGENASKVVLNGPILHLEL